MWVLSNSAFYIQHSFPPSKMKKLFTTIFILVSINSFSGNLDSLTAALKNANDTTQVNLLNDLSFGHVFEDPNLGKKYALKALQKATIIGYKKGIAKAYMRLGIAYDISSNTDSAEIKYDEAIAIYEQINDPKGVASGYNNKAMIYSNKGLFDKSIGLYFKALLAFDKIADTLGQANTLNNIAVLYNDMFKHKLALKYAKQALILYQQIHHQKGIAAVYTNIALAFESTQMDSTLYYHHAAAAIKLALNDQYGLGITYNDLATNYGELKQFDSAFFYFDKAYKIKQQFEDEYGMASVLTNKASVFLTAGNLEKQHEALLQALKITQKINNTKLLARITHALAHYYANKKNWAKAFEFLVAHNKHRNVMINEENTKQITELDAKYQSEKKDLLLANSALELKNSEAKIKQSRTQIGLLIAGILTLLTAGTLFWVIVKNKQKSAAILRQIEQEHERNKAIIFAEEKERIRIAKDLHDGPGQLLAAVKMNLSAIENPTAVLPPIFKLLDDAITEVRNVSHSMMPLALINHDLTAALNELTNQIKTQININTQLVDIPQNLPQTMQTSIYRIAQECINNTLKHAQASAINMQLIYHQTHLTFMFEDNGIGFNPQQQYNGVGMQNISSRVALLNGRVDIDSNAQIGTTITVEIPI